MSNLASNAERWFCDSRGEAFCVQKLSADLARVHSDWLLTTHNTIPYQHWTEADLFADGDARRSYTDKWKISRIALSPTGAPLAFCIGFEMQPDSEYYREPGVYLHRLAVAPQFRGRMIGLLLQAETIVQAFCRGLIQSGSTSYPVVLFGQTSESPENNSVLLFHKAAGFREVGKKPYANRTDLVLRMEAADFWASRHAQKWRVSGLTVGLRSSLPPRFGTEATVTASASETSRSSSAKQQTALSSETIAGVKHVLSYLTGIPSEEIVASDDLTELLAMDSLSMTELWLGLEEHFQLRLVQDEILSLRTVDEVANYVLGAASAERPS